MSALSLLVLLLSLGASAAPLEEDPAYAAGLALFEDFEYEKATFRFDEALLVEGRDVVEQATILIRLGMTWAELRQQNKAQDAFVRALKNDPYATLPPDAPPKTQALLEAARRQVREERALALSAKTPPDEAAADVNPKKDDEQDASSPVAEPSAASPGVASPTPESLAAAGTGLPWILITGGSTLAVGAALSVIGGATWAAGLGLREVGNGQEFQTDALAYGLPSQIAQYAGQGFVAVGVLVLVIGGGLTVAALIVE